MTSLDSPLLAFRSSPECCHSSAAASLSLKTAWQLPSLRFLPLRRFPNNGQPLTSQGYQPWVTVPSQRFSRSQGFHPSVVCRPCFMPVPPLGFSPSGPISLMKRSALSSFSALLRLAPLAVTASTDAFLTSLGFYSPSSFQSSRSSTSLDLPHFRAFFLTSVPVFCRSILTIRRPRPSWASSSLGISPFPPTGTPRSPILS